ncbi:MAG: hypothetical protein A2X28_09375 [Elusimicrobia bacterium GWA2_56_46]|nr:MAG: hypothetical protein A2X28_09375 [Elusimicrobia bacterium GWA2_56_46]OGR55573.1 MAG: hypothetical protein A2X39_08595 [Elusimicrobia bacterium GWC2_56_31]HBB67457.1 hypothetical protein [Elusimicrobiota bacterium]HBW22021.1 hypothetical protein [Elusimicrobiota bacterium]
MNRTVILPLLLTLAVCRADAAGEEAPALSTQPAVTAELIPGQQPGHAAGILSALKHLSILLNKASLVDQKELGKVAGEIDKLDARVKDLLGPAILREMEEQENELLVKARMAAAKAELLNVRTALITYYGNTEGNYPATPAELVPEYLPAMPELELPQHAKTAAIELSSGPVTGERISDTGGWLYINDPKSAGFGMIVLNCSHKDDQGIELYKY